MAKGQHATNDETGKFDTAASAARMDNSFGKMHLTLKQLPAVVTDTSIRKPQSFHFRALYLPLTVQLRVREDGCHNGGSMTWRIAVHGTDYLQQYFIVQLQSADRHYDPRSDNRT